MKIYTFNINLRGSGETPEEAWQDAIEGFCQEPGIYEEYDIEELEES